MNVDDFMKERVDDQIDWYKRKSGWNKKCYQYLRAIEIIAATSIPFLVGYMSLNASYVRTSVGLLGVLIAVIAGIISLYRFQENWVQYRTTCESLIHERFLFLTKAEPYDVDSPFQLFVQRIESVVSTENTRWSQYVKSPGKEKESGQG